LKNSKLTPRQSLRFLSYLREKYPAALPWDTEEEFVFREVNYGEKVRKPGSPRFDGATYSPEHDDLRLGAQIKRIFNLMKDGHYRTLDEISVLTNDPHASISAQLRHLRKPRFGSHEVHKRPRGDRNRGLYEYKLWINADSKVRFD
jgi:hypothetical protein